jgi:hypothetical protein
MAISGAPSGSEILKSQEVPAKQTEQRTKFSGVRIEQSKGVTSSNLLTIQVLRHQYFNFEFFAGGHRQFVHCVRYQQTR